MPSFLKSQKGLSPIIVILITIGIIAIAGGIYWWQKTAIKESTPAPTFTTPTMPTSTPHTATPITPTSTPSTSTPTPPATFQPKSKFLKDDATAQKIASVQILSYQLAKSPSKNSFGFKFISGLVQLGYIYPKSDPSALQMLQNFEKDQNLPISTVVNSKVLQKLDILLEEQESSEAQLAKTFPLYNDMASLPADYPTKNHALYIYATVFRSLPTQLANWTFDNFKIFYNRHQIADPITYYFGYCPSLDCLSRDDFTLAATLLHEYAHYLEACKQVGTKGFYEIDWNVDNSDWANLIINPKRLGSLNAVGSLSATPKDPIKRSSPVNPVLYPNNQGFLYHEGSISQYAGALLSGGAQEGKTNDIREDFAESFAAYVLEGQVFRGKAANNTIIAQKYNWLKTNVFQGKEYQTGNANYATLDFAPSDNDQGFKSIPAKVEDYSLLDPSFVKWDFQIK